MMFVIEGLKNYDEEGNLESVGVQIFRAELRETEDESELVYGEKDLEAHSIILCRVKNQIPLFRGRLSACFRSILNHNEDVSGLVLNHIYVKSRHGDPVAFRMKDEFFRLGFGISSVSEALRDVLLGEDSFDIMSRWLLAKNVLMKLDELNLPDLGTQKLELRTQVRALEDQMIYRAITIPKRVRWVRSALGSV